jgi:hypothetical protein
MKGCIKPISVPSALKSYLCRTVYSKHLQQPDYLADNLNSSAMTLLRSFLSWSARKFPIVIALELWGKYMANSKVLFLSDNQAVVDVLNKQSCRVKILMRLIRRLVLCTLSYNIVFRAKHKYGGIAYIS